MRGSGSNDDERGDEHEYELEEGQYRAYSDQRESLLWAVMLVAAGGIGTAAATREATVAAPAILVGGTAMLAAVVRTSWLTSEIIEGARRRRELERRRPRIPQRERRIQSDAWGKHLPARRNWIRLMWPRKGRSQQLAGRYAFYPLASLPTWLGMVSDRSWILTGAIIAVNVLLLGACVRLFFVGNRHWSDLECRERENPTVR